MAEAQKITPFIWFEKQAEEAAGLYTSIFRNSSVKSVSRQGETVFTIVFSIGGQEFVGLNGGPTFRPNASVSFYTICETEGETDAAWEKLCEGGEIRMPLDKYPWSEKYGWVQDRFGVNWQLTLGKIADFGQKVAPVLMFTGAQQGKAETAIQLYTSLFSNSGIRFISRYPAGGADPEGTVQHAQFLLNSQVFIAMDSALSHKFQFNEGVSFVIDCADQREVDYFWEKLIADGGSESRCGWLKDPFGVSWQVIPAIFPKLMTDPDPAKVQRTMQAMMTMGKLDIEILLQAAAGDPGN